MASLSLRGVGKSFGGVDVIHDVDLGIEDGEFVVFVGPSGCGKSTLLRLIAGLESATAGDIYIGDARVNDIAPGDRGAAMVFQSYALYPHMTVRDNISFGLRMTTKLSAADINRRVAAAAEALHLTPLLERKPRQLSGGQRQRTAIGRAIVREPKVFLLDEPLSNLDAELRAAMRIELRQLHRRLGATMIYVTHDQVEAMTLADRIVALNAGRVEQTGAPLELYSRPRNRFVAGFIGSPKMNFFPAVARRSGGGDGGGEILLRLTSVGNDAEPAELVLPAADWRIADGEQVTVGARPDALYSGGGIDGGDSGDNGDGAARFTLAVDASEHLGGETFHYCRTPNDPDSATVIVKARADTPPGKLPLRLRPTDAHVFNKTGDSCRAATGGD
ncbi:MAG: sn-glycerol-3-phosphate ABC transporter ATP-binding protein UgpC [Gammaproteobacteria bacterium]|nr:sn-glycerol-3-phosphate ABC transporter ATP-binding protein UgpC [Gammaproteobacteria bacterium]